MEPKCKNCLLFDGNFCKVVILHEGERIHIPVEAEDLCFFENKFEAISQEEKNGEILNKTEEFQTEVQEVKFWVEDEEGNKTDGNGVVKIKYPEGFF